MADEIWLLRHAETEWSKSGKHTGRTDIPLTEKGRAVARALRERVAGHEFAAVLSSPLSRARETAELAGLEVTGVRDELLEWDYGAYEGRTTKDIRVDPLRLGWAAPKLGRGDLPDGLQPGQRLLDHGDPQAKA